MESSFQSQWDIEQLVADLPEFARRDKGEDLLACLLTGKRDGRRIYVYLHHRSETTIAYDLEDWEMDTGNVDHAVERGEVESPGLLKALCEWWLGDGRLAPDRIVRWRYDQG